MEIPSVLDFEDYRMYLRTTLEEISRTNPSFSLRGFSRLTGISASHLSRTLAGQKKLSLATAQQISSALGHNPRESSHFANLIELEKANSEEKRARVLSRLAGKKASRTRIVSIETFKVISDWYHFAIIALTTTKGFQDNAHWIAKRLGIKPLEARFAIERLLSLGYLQETKKGLRAPDDDINITTTDDIPSAAIHENHRQHMEIAGRALREIEVELREFNNLTLAMNISDVPKAKKAIRAFIDDFNDEFETIPSQELFQINVQFYPLTKSEKGNA